MALTAGRLAERLGATLRGEPGVEIHSVASLETAGPGQVAFLVNPRYRPHLRSTRASAVILAPEDAWEGVACLVTPNPYLAFARAVEILHGKDHPRRGVEGGARVHPGARVADGATVMAGACVEEGAGVGAGSVLYPGAYVGPGARVGRDCVLHPNAVVREGCVLGERVILQPGAVVGSDGFGYARDGARAVKIPQVGIAVLEDDVEVGACAAIDRAALGETRVGRGTKIDNLVQVGHNVVVGEDCVLVAQVGVSGSTRPGRGVGPSRGWRRTSPRGAPCRGVPPSSTGSGSGFRPRCGGCRPCGGRFGSWNGGCGSSSGPAAERRRHEGRPRDPGHAAPPLPLPPGGSGGGGGAG